MTLGEFAYLLDADPKWVLNVAAGLPGGLRYTVPAARRLAVARALQEATAMPMSRAYLIAADVLRRFDGTESPVAVPAEDAPVAIMIDVYRILAAVYTGLSRLRTMYAPGVRGRRAAGRDPVARAAAHGLDLSLLRSNLQRSKEQRLRQLDAMATFRSNVRRAGAG